MDIAPSESADVTRVHHTRNECGIGRPGREFGWSSLSTRMPSRRSFHQRREAVGGLDVRPRAKRLPDRERLSQQRCAPQGASSGHGTLCRRPLASVRRMTTGLGAGLRSPPAPLRAGRRWFSTTGKPTDGLQKRPKGVVHLQTNCRRSVIPLYARCTQHAFLRKTQELSSITEHVPCRFECCPRVPLMSYARQGGYR